MKNQSKICKICKLPKPIFSKGRCVDCTRKTSKGLKRTPLKKKIVQKEKSSCIKHYFVFFLIKCEKSEESGIKISDPTKANICHIFDKARHPSLACDLRNHIYLTLDEHQQFDNLLYTHQFEKLEKQFQKSWQIACTRARKIIHLCEENTNFLIKFKEYLNKNE